MFPVRVLAPIFALVLSVASAAAQPMLPRTAQAVYEIARTFGNIEFADPDSDGRPVLVGDIDGVLYSIVLFGCDAPEGCASVQFYASFITDENSRLEFVNDWNRETRWVTAFLENDGDVVIAMTANIRHGITRQNFMDTLDVWSTLMRDFNDHIYGVAPVAPRK